MQWLYANMEISLQQTIHTNKTSAQPQKTIHPQTFWIVHKSLSRPRRGQTPLNRRRSERGEHNLRQVETTPTVPEGGEYQFVVRPLRGRYYLRIHTASSASLHMRLSLIGRLRRPATHCCHPKGLRMNRKRRQTATQKTANDVVKGNLLSCEKRPFITS